MYGKIIIGNSQPHTNVDNKRDKAADRILEILEECFHNDRESARNLMFLIIMSSIKSEALNMTNESIADVLVSELDSAMHVNFGQVNTREIWKNILRDIVKMDMMSKS